MRSLALLLSTATLLLSVSAQAQKKGPDVYEIDPSHTFVMFKVNHLGFSNSYGRFTDVKGTVTVNEAKPEASSVDITIATESITTQDEKRDKHLKSPDFFNTKQFPKITFKSTKVKMVKDKVYQVEGNLNLHGVTKPVSFEFTRQRTGNDPWGNTKTGGDFTLNIKRSDYGMSYMQGADQIGDEVHIFASIEGALKKK